MTNKDLIQALKSGEYYGTHIMQAWVTIREQDKRIAELESELKQYKQRELQRKRLLTITRQG